MGFPIFYTITLQAGCKFSLSMQMFGLHSPSRCLLFILNMFHKLDLPLNKTFFVSSLTLNHLKGRVSSFLSNVKLDQSKLR